MDNTYKAWCNQCRKQSEHLNGLCTKCAYKPLPATGGAVDLSLPKDPEEKSK